MRLSQVLSWPRAVLRFLKAAYKDNVLFYASALSFDGLLASIPLALLFVALIGFFFRQSSTSEINSVLQLLLPSYTESPNNPLGKAVEIIEAVVGSRAQLSLYGLPLFLVFSTRLFAAVRIALNHILHVPVNRSVARSLGVDFSLVLITTVLFAANSFVSIPVFEFTFVDVFLGHLLAVVFGIVLFFIVYSLAPDAPVKWDTALIAAVFASLAFEVAKFLFSIYLANVATINQLISHANAVAIILFVFWIYYSALVFLLGAEVAKAHIAFKRVRSREKARATAATTA
jgi:membrane protein